MIVENSPASLARLLQFIIPNLDNMTIEANPKQK